MLGLAFPYTSLSLIWASSFLLFALLFLNTLAVDKRKLITFRSGWLQCVSAQLLIFLFFPVLQTALASLLLRDQDFVFGVAVAALAPCALVNPFFAGQRGGDTGLALLNVIVSTLLCPFVTVPLLALSKLAPVFLDTRYLLVYLSLLTVVPVALSFTVSYFFPKLPSRAAKWLPTGNSLILALLMFILVGSSLNRVPLRLLLNYDFAVLVGLFLFFDFGVFLITFKGAQGFIKKAKAETMALSVSSRNFAVSSSLMLAFHPKAALPSAVGLIIHCFFFQWLLNAKKGAR